MTDLHQALRLDDPSRLAVYRRTTELVSPIAEATIDCLIGKALAEATNEKEVLDLVRLKMIQLYAGIVAQVTLAMSDMASLKRTLAERQPAAEGMSQ